MSIGYLSQSIYCVVAYVSEFFPNDVQLRCVVSYRFSTSFGLGKLGNATG